VPDAGGDGLPGQGGPGGLAHEAQRAAGGHDPDLVTALGEPPQQLTGLVGGDTAADTEDDARRHVLTVPVAGRLELDVRRWVPPSRGRRAGPGGSRAARWTAASPGPGSRPAGRRTPAGPRRAERSGR